MSDNLVKRLRDCANGIGDFKNDLGDFGLCDTAADRIEELEAVIDRQHKRAETLAEGWRIADDARIELEAKLEKAVMSIADLFRLHLRRGPAWDHPPTKEIMDTARTTLAELKGETDD